MAETQAIAGMSGAARSVSPIRAWLRPHRIVLILIGLALIVAMALTMRWDWLATYSWPLMLGMWQTVWLLAASVVLGFILAVPLGLAQAAGPWILAAPARGFCTLIRG